MILQSLYNYYNILRNDSEVKIAEPGYSSAPVSHALNLSSQGELLDIITLYMSDPKGKEIPLRINIPAQVKRSVNIAANFLCDNCVYVLGITDKDSKDPDYAIKRFEEFKNLNIKILEGVNSTAAHAVITFLKNHDPNKVTQNAVIAKKMDDLLKGSNIIFYVEGKNVIEDKSIRAAWEKYHFGRETLKMQCLVTGKEEKIARLHPDIKGVKGAQTKGASLVSFNLDSFTSYGREQGFNSPVSCRVAEGYGVALNYLLSKQNPNPKIYFGDTAVVYWADAPDKRHASAFYSLLNPDFLQENQKGGKTDETKGKRIRAKAKEKELGEVAENVTQGKAMDLKKLGEGLDKETRLYVLGLSPNAARLSVRFFLTEPFGVFARRIIQHYDDLQIEKEFDNQPSYFSPYRILAECVSPKITRRDDEVKKSLSLLGGAFMRSILLATPYPEGLYIAIINRIRHDTDNVKINYIRAAYIKAHLIRKYRYQEKKHSSFSNPYKEALQMSLNENYNQPAYVLGRLFAVLEKVQKEAIGTEINATIKDRYFASACATPASVFPTLLRQSNHWINKAAYGKKSERMIQDLLNRLEASPFPSRLSLEEQGIFVLGYYHQVRNLYKSNKEDSKTDQAILNK